LLTSEENGVRLYLQEEQRLDYLAQSDVSLRVHRPVNPHDLVWGRTVERVRHLVCTRGVVSFHCTRLTQTEMDDVRANGLRPLSPSFTRRRIERLAQQNLISPRAAQALKKHNEASASNREEKIWFFHCLSTLRDESGLYRLFRSWGGEALYHHHEKDSPAGDDLRRSGTPCIALAALRPSDICPFASFEEQMIWVWLDRDDSNAPSRDCDTYLRCRSVPVFDVIVRADRRFEELTDCSNWRCSIDSD